MTETDAALIVRRLYWLALVVGVVGTTTFGALQGWRSATAFGLGALASVGNLWLFERLARSIAPKEEGETAKHPWQPGVLILRYFLLFTFGYAIVKTLSVNALAVVLGLLTSTAAVIASSLFEILESFFVNRSTR